MFTPNIKILHAYIQGDLLKEIRWRYLNLLILSEADLQSHMCELLAKFLHDKENRAGLHKVLNKPYLKELNIHPDLVIFRNGEPWIVMELKEGKRLKEISASKEYERLIKVKKHFEQKDYKIRRGYLFYVARYHSHAVIEKPAKRFLYEVPAVLADFYPDDELKKWEREYNKWAKYVANPSEPDEEVTDSPIAQTPRATAYSQMGLLHCTIKGITAYGEYLPDGNRFRVLKGSQAVLQHRASAKRIKDLREELTEKRVLAPRKNCLVFKKDYEFSSPSYAAGVVRGGNTNGWIQWKNDDHKTLRALKGR